MRRAADRPLRAFYRILQGAGLPRLRYRLHTAWLRARPPLTLGVRTLVADAERRILLVRHSYRPGWYLPGGGVRRWETLAEAALRETREEAGLALLDLGAPAGIFANFTAERSDHVVLFYATRWAVVGTASLEIAESGFFPADALPDGTTGPTRRRIAEWLGCRHPDGTW